MSFRHIKRKLKRATARGSFAVKRLLDKLVDRQSSSLKQAQQRVVLDLNHLEIQTYD